jgi:hypothetical protein
MEILIFDMDGVLLEAKGYHQALQETVRLAGEHLSLRNIQLTQEQIHTFESVGISSEWHSSALCMAFLQIQILSGVASPSMSLDELFNILQNQPLELPAIERSLAVIKLLCEQHQVDSNAVVATIVECEDIDRSLTMQWFQELVLGSQAYQERYKKPSRFNSKSYLQMYDIPLLSPQNAEKITHHVDVSRVGAAIMTNRPSIGPSGFSGSPEAELGLGLVQLSNIPVTGYGDISWLAENIQVEPGTLVKPNPTHALAAILGSLQLEKTKSLRQSLTDPVKWPREISELLHGGTITVFEDTPGGLASVINAEKVLKNAGIIVDIRLLGVTKEKSKKIVLEAQGAKIFPDINAALFSLDHFGTFTRD